MEDRHSQEFNFLQVYNLKFFFVSFTGLPQMNTNLKLKSKKVLISCVG